MTPAAVGDRTGARRIPHGHLCGTDGPVGGPGPRTSPDPSSAPPPATAGRAHHHPGSGAASLSASAAT
jgi:hypothetical protein